ncbi:hypothetical protein [Siphonobacter curvatus]|uniref:hypothetical protein n=1 Tax=Siphonobacter curvatus TaxID=2094562 RepID=UPI001FAECF2A|nr:hypothetical protein [Siphonobacter curvatus]
MLKSIIGHFPKIELDYRTFIFIYLLKQFNHSLRLHPLKASAITGNKTMGIEITGNFSPAVAKALKFLGESLGIELTMQRSFAFSLLRYLSGSTQSKPPFLFLSEDFPGFDPRLDLARIETL